MFDFIILLLSLIFKSNKPRYIMLNTLIQDKITAVHNLSWLIAFCSMTKKSLYS